MTATVIDLAQQRDREAMRRLHAGAPCPPRRLTLSELLGWPPVPGGAA